MNLNSSRYGLSNDNTCFDKVTIQSYDDGNINTINQNIRNDVINNSQNIDLSDNLTTGRSINYDDIPFRTLKSKYLHRHTKKCAILSYDFFKNDDFTPVHIPSAWEMVNGIKLTYPDLYRILKKLLFYFEIRYDSKEIFSKEEFIDIADQHYNCIITIDDGYFSTLIIPNNALFEYFQARSKMCKLLNDTIGKKISKDRTSQLNDKCNKLLYGTQKINKDKIEAFVVHNIHDKYINLNNQSYNLTNECQSVPHVSESSKKELEKWSFENIRDKKFNNNDVSINQSTLKRIFSSVKPKGSARSSAESINNDQ